MFFGLRNGLALSILTKVAKDASRGGDNGLPAAGCLHASTWNSIAELTREEGRARDKKLSLRMSRLCGTYKLELSLERLEPSHTLNLPNGSLLVHPTLMPPSTTRPSVRRKVYALHRTFMFPLLRS